MQLQVHCMKTIRDEPDNIGFKHANNLVHILRLLALILLLITAFLLLLLDIVLGSGRTGRRLS